REDALHAVEDLACSLLDVILVVAAEEERDVVVLEAYFRGVARGATRVEQRACVRSEVEGQVLLGRRRDVGAEVREAPGGGDRQAGRRSREVAVELLHPLGA